MYEQGYATSRYRGTPDLDEAYAWYRRAAASGSQRAYEHLLKSYSQRLLYGPNYEGFIEGDPMGRPLEEARAWRQEMAEAGRAEAQLRLGLAYHRGYSFERNLETARAWYERAAAGGNAEAKQLLEKVRAEIDRGD